MYLATAYYCLYCLSIIHLCLISNLTERITAVCLCYCLSILSAFLRSGWNPSEPTNFTDFFADFSWWNFMRFFTAIAYIFLHKCACTAIEGPVRIQYKCLVPIYVLPKMKLLFPKQNYNVLSPSYISVRALYISRIGLPILLQGNMWTVPGNTVHKSLTDTWMWKLGLRLRNSQKRNT